MLTSKTSRVWTGVAFVLSIIAIGLAFWLFLNRQLVLDQVSVWTYEPTASILELNDKVRFTDKGQFSFYSTRPVIANPSEFNSKCPRQEAGSPILGCYTSDHRIYVFDINNAQLDGMKEVTAAHEMLHAVWVRMDQAEQQRIGGLLTAAYQQSASPELRERMSYYERNEPDAITNELHSILGTEVAGLGEELEAYYAQFFTSRQLILDLHAKYDSVYKELNSRAEVLFDEMEAIAADIQAQSDAYDVEVAQLSRDIDSFNARANSGSFSSIAQFNRERSALVARSSGLEAKRNAINNDIASYNVLYEEYKTISSQIELLNNSVDSFKALEETPTVE